MRRWLSDGGLSWKTIQHHGTSGEREWDCWFAAAGVEGRIFWMTQDFPCRTGLLGAIASPGPFVGIQVPTLNLDHLYYRTCQMQDRFYEPSSWWDLYPVLYLFGLCYWGNIQFRIDKFEVWRYDPSQLVLMNVTDTLFLHISHFVPYSTVLLPRSSVFAYSIWKYHELSSVVGRYSIGKNHEISTYFWSSIWVMKEPLGLGRPSYSPRRLWMVSHPQREAFSINGGTPKWMNFSLEHLIYEWIWGVPLFMEPPHMNSPQKIPTASPVGFPQPSRSGGGECWCKRHLAWTWRRASISTWCGTSVEMSQTHGIQVLEHQPCLDKIGWMWHNMTMWLCHFLFVPGQSSLFF